MSVMTPDTLRLDEKTSMEGKECPVSGLLLSLGFCESHNRLHS